MKKLFLPMVLVPMIAFAQLGTGYVGLNTANPHATLDVNGVPNDTNKFDGIIAPRLTGQQLAAKNYGDLQIGSIVYITTIPTTFVGQVVNVNSPGYYYFDGKTWKSFTSSKTADTLADVVQRGNHSPKVITFTGGATGEEENDGAVGMKVSTYSYFFGNMNPSHTGYYNGSFGYNSLSKLTTGGYNNSFGTNSLSKLTTASFNTAFGSYSMANSTGYKNSYFGTYAGQDETSGNFNTRVGYASGIQSTIGGLYNLYLGAFTGQKVYGNNNVFIGFGAGISNNALPQINVNNRLVIHSNSSLTGATNTSEGNWSNLNDSSITNGLIIGDFAERWVRFNGRFQIDPSRISASTKFHTKFLIYNPTDGDVSSKDFSDVLTTAGTTIGKPIYGDLQYNGGDGPTYKGGKGFYHESNTRTTGFTIINDDVNPSAIIYSLNKSDGHISQISVDGAGTILQGRILGDPTFPTPTASNEIVQKAWVETLVNSKVTVPAPPSTGTYILKSMNGVISWVSE